MKSIKIAGLCLVAMFAVSLVASATASAAPVWKQCRESTEKEPPTKWEDSKCSKALAAGKWQWRELTTTEKVTSSATLRLFDTKTLAGESEVECSGTDTGTIGPKQYDRVETVTVKSCKALKVCEASLEPKAKAIHLPWQTELFETEGKQRNKITEVSPNGEPGWEVTCKAPILGETTDTCTTVSGEEGSTLMTDLQSGIVEAEFEKNSGTAKCSLGGAKSGKVLGIDDNLSVEGWAISVS